MNGFYLSLEPDDERPRVESLEPFDEYETLVPWPLMLHPFCSELLEEPEKTSVLLMDGGENCFSFGTHLNPHPVTVDPSAALG
ncbi:hypothetical protein NHX12_007164 [Muraenolepis orangiensis]|uniref:Uncharacterized protein n=1 Tax=Muraenolepis orangiensis TaxID=630683 RepID=A0A9Q0DPB9_9TELE|nr:hypothetical protein NHX12_007164 [Muraenolepis orangiensis]